MIQIPDAQYVPDLDAARIAGGLIGMTGFAPLQRGPYGSVSTNEVYAVQGTTALHAETFRQLNDTVRLLVFNKQAIDEYDYDGTRTNRGVGYSASTTTWDAAAWGNYIYACNYHDATQVSNGTSFSAVGDDCPKARWVAANVNFVMLADTDDGVDQLSDQVWWSALQDPTEWTPSIATQAGKVRLLDAPGPIKRLVAFRDVFVAFKENSIFVGEYVGPPFLFQWRMVSSRIGLAASYAVCELDDALYFVHTSGVYKWDGAQLSNVGLPVWQTILNTIAHNAIPAGSNAGDMPSPGSGRSGVPLTALRMIGDDVDGVVWIACYTQSITTSRYRPVLYGFNVRTQKWGAIGSLQYEGENPAIFVDAKHSDMRAYLQSDMPAQARVWYVDNVLAGSRMRDLRYPDAWDTSKIVGSVATALQGTVKGSTDAVRVYARCLNGSDGGPFDTCTLYGWANEQRNVGAQTSACVINTELDCFDGRLNAKLKLAYLTGGTAKWCLLSGIGIEYPPLGSR
jgi:hypothetical protein